MKKIILHQLMLIAFGTLMIFIHQLVPASETLQKPASRVAEPGMTYGQSPELPLPKTILFTGEPNQLINDAEEWARRGIQGFFLNRIAREWADDIWATDGKPWTIGEADETFQKTKAANMICKKSVRIPF